MNMLKTLGLVLSTAVVLSGCDAAPSAVASAPVDTHLSALQSDPAVGLIRPQASSAHVHRGLVTCERGAIRCLFRGEGLRHSFNQRFRLP